MSKPAMKATAKRKPSGRLNRFVDLPQGLTPELALMQADMNLAAHRETALAGIDAAIAGLMGLADRAQDEIPEDHQRLVDLTREIAGVAGFYNLAPLGVAAQSLNDLIQSCHARRMWDQSGFMVHLAAIRVLRKSEWTDSGAEQEILQGLTQIVKRNAGAP